MVNLSLPKNSRTYGEGRTGFFKSLFRVLLLATFAVWFGGFFFYAAFVVPLGTEVLGSARAQGFITRLVTHRINGLCFATLVLMAIELIGCWHWSPRWSRMAQLGSIALIGALLISLVLIHPQLDKMLDVPRKQVHDRADFYQLHRVYLWASTIQWGLAWVWLVAVLTNWSGEIRFRHSSKASQSD